MKKNESLIFEFRNHPGQCQLMIRLERLREHEFKDSWRKPFCCLRCAGFCFQRVPMCIFEIAGFVSGLNTTFCVTIGEMKGNDDMFKCLRFLPWILNVSIVKELFL